MEDLVPDTALSPEEQAEQAETQATVWNAIAQLSPAQRAAVVRRYYLGLTDAENALASGQNVGAIKQLLHRARRRLGLLLSNE
jgi:RNA polymerase sigma-70 factor (ECF subfamily)